MEFFRGDLSPEPKLRLTKELLIASRIPKSLWHCNVSKVPEAFPYRKALDNYVADLPVFDRKGRGLYLYGPYGRGKSGAAVAVVKEAMCRGGRAIFFSALELDSVFGKGLDEDLRRAVLSTHFLIFDDVGAEKAIPWSPQWVETVIKLRNNDNLPTIITSNDRPIDFMGRLKSVASILGGRYQDVLVDGHDWRMDGPPKIEVPITAAAQPETIKAILEAKETQVIGSMSDVSWLLSLMATKPQTNTVDVKSKLASYFNVSAQSIYNWAKKTGVPSHRLVAYTEVRANIIKEFEGI